MHDAIADRVGELPGLNKPALFKLWKHLFEASPPPQLRRQLMVPILAYRIQEQTLGSLKATALLRLRQLGKGLETKVTAANSAVPPLKPGTHLVRQWRDRVHLVNVQDNGYEYQGAHYKNLSEIARLITGTRWSGPLFFGIKSEPTNSKSKEAR